MNYKIIEEENNKKKLTNGELLLKIHKDFGDFEYTKIFKNILTHNETCPICLKPMHYEKSICKNCGFDIEDIFSLKDVKDMKKIQEFVENNESLKKQVEYMTERDIHEDDFIHDMYTEIFFDEELRKEYEKSHLNEVCDLDEYFDWLIEDEKENDDVNNAEIDFCEIDFCKLADNNYRLNQRENDDLIIPVDLNKYKYFKSIEETNDDELSLYDLSFVPWFLREKIRELSFEEGYLTHNATKENWHDFSKSQNTKKLKEFLRKHGVKPLQTKKEVVKQIFDSDLPLNEFESEKTYLTKNAYDYLEEYEWIGFYRKYLIYFDFLDFFYYLETREGSIEEISLEYIEKHIELAIESLDYDYIIKSYTTKSKICHKINYLEDALKCDMRILILNMNPICLNYNFYQWHAPLDIENIANLKMLKSKFGEKRLLETFNENWNFMGFKSTLIPKEEVWNHLITALNSKEQNHGSRKLEKNT